MKLRYFCRQRRHSKVSAAKPALRQRGRNGCEGEGDLHFFMYDTLYHLKWMLFNDWGSLAAVAGEDDGKEPDGLRLTNADKLKIAKNSKTFDRSFVQHERI